MAAKPPLLELRSRLGPSQDCLLLLESQWLSAIFDAQDMLCASALVSFRCLPFRVLPCRGDLDSVAFTGTLKWLHGVTTPSPAAAKLGYFAVNFGCPVFSGGSSRF
jgi:hypothetical protein